MKNTSPAPFLLQGKNIILVLDNKSHTISQDTHMNYSKILDALKSKDWNALPDLVEPKKAIINFGKGYVTINNDGVFWKGNPFPNALSSRMIEMYQVGFSLEPMVAFMEHLMMNPSKRSVDQVYGFLEKNSLPITDDGYFLAYKKVRPDYLDIHSSTISNRVGEVVSMDRNLVDDDPDSHCSTGLHFCSESYLQSFGGSDYPVMILKINPADVVSIPTDYNGAKGRCSRYEVVGQVNGDPKVAFTSVVNTQYTPAAPDTTINTVESEVWPANNAVAEVASAAWPFPTASAPAISAGKAQRYDIVRMYGDDRTPLIANITLDAARVRVQSNISQKKARLEIVKTGTSVKVN